jgi:hypothetical protein
LGMCTVAPSAPTFTGIAHKSTYRPFNPGKRWDDRNDRNELD